MRFQGIENDCFLLLVASLESDLNLSETRLLLVWGANAYNYKITNQQIMFELKMKSPNVSKGLKSLCKKEWLVAEVVYINRWDEPVKMYYLHPKRMEIIKQMVEERTKKVTYKPSQNNGESFSVEPSRQDKDNLELKFDEFVKKYNLKDRSSREEHGMDVCQNFFLENKNELYSLDGLEVIKSKYIKLFCHKSKNMTPGQYAEWKSQVSSIWQENLTNCLGKEKIRHLKYIPNDHNIKCVYAIFTEDDFSIAFQVYGEIRPGLDFEVFKKHYVADLDIKIQDGMSNGTLPTIEDYLNIHINANKNTLAELQKMSVSTNQSMRKTCVSAHQAIYADGIVKTEHLVTTMPDEDDEGDPYYIPPEECISLKPEDFAPMEYDLDFCKSLGVDPSGLK